MNEAIKLAIEKGGYDTSWQTPAGRVYPTTHLLEIFAAEVMQDPKFWQALGKALGWGTEMFDEDDGKTRWHYFGHCPIDGEIVMGDRDECPNECETENPSIISWLYHALQYHKLNLTGGDTEKFFRDLLKQQQ